ncbi:phosphate-starvation-inducible PsiE family protein [Methylocaldum gracile]|jgi:uncharacterized membrane protein (DUF373 family)|uniref:phosphate-starvation-inducible PsiE family protein n=1 Tax=unclassified Methylocaldum TaxID=2622260 RepID=UPI00105E7489
MQISNGWKATKEEWAILSYYQRFESLVAFVLTIVIGLTILVALIALLAVVRKFIILEVQDVSAGHLLGLAAITLVLGLTYWLIREAV